MPAYDDKATDQALEELQKKIAEQYHDAYKEIAQTAKEYWSDLRPRYAQEYKAYQEGKAGYANLDPKVAKAKFDAWYASQIGRGERWENLRDKMAKRVNEANKAASAYINDTTPGIYSLNANYQAYLIEQATGSADFTIYDERTVADLIQGKTQILATTRVNGAQGEARARDQLQKALTSGILQGQSIDKIATQFERVTDMSRNAAIRNARTAVTQAQNAGRQDTYERAEAMGIEMQKEWIATEDDRTRDSHAELDGVRVGVHDPYPNGLMYPGDESTGDGSEFYNCRCTERAIITKYNGEARETRIQGHEGYHDEKSYKKWLGEKRAAKMDESPLTHADATARAMEAAEDRREAAAEKAQSEQIQEADQGGPITNDFTPAKTIEEAEAFVSQYVDDKQFGALGVSYKGVSVDVANEINKAVSNVFDNFNIPPLGGVYAPTLNSKTGKAIQGATAAYSPIRNTILINKTTMKDIETALAHFKEEENAVQRFLSNPDNYDLSRMNSRVANILSNSFESGRGNVPDNIEEAIYHELGHYFERVAKASDKYDKIVDTWEEYSPKISGYATDSMGEYIAESLCAYMKGEEIEPNLKAVFDEKRK